MGKFKHHRFNELFEQLGLNSDPDSINHFIEQHSLSANEELLSAPFWNDSQRQFLEQAWHDDAEWVGMVDLLNSQLRK